MIKSFTIIMNIMKSAFLSILSKHEGCEYSIKLFLSFHNILSNVRCRIQHGFGMYSIHTQNPMEISFLF